MRGPSLFDVLPPPKSESNWKPEAPYLPPDATDIELDWETTGIRWWDGDLPVGGAVGYWRGDEYIARYYPWAHEGGGNLDEAQCAEFFKREIRGKHITNLNTRFEIHMAREWGKKWGIDLELQGNTFGDVAHDAALLDDHRQRFSLAALVDEFLKEDGEAKVEVVDGIKLNTSAMNTYHAGIVATRACADVRQVGKLKRIFRPRLEAEDLLRVWRVEQRLIPVVAEMEKNGTLIDVERLHRWIKQVNREINQGLLAISKVSGLKFTNPDSPRDMQMLFEHCDLPLSYTSGNRPSFTAEILKKIEHPLIQQAFRIGKLIDVRSKLKKYAESVNESTGMLRFALHQLRSVKDEHDENSAGTISGRFSSTKIDNKEDEGINIQAVWKPSRQRVAFGYDEDDSSHDDDIFIIRRLHVPEKGKQHLSADAMQIEYRLFADDTRSQRLLDFYAADPLLSYHKMIHAELKRWKPDLTYRRCKDTNFANQYGAGLRKKALMLEFISVAKYLQLLRDDNWFNDPSLDPVKEINAIYDQAVPEVKPLMEKAKHLAMDRCDERCKRTGLSRELHRLYEHRGYIRTLLGRRARFYNNERVHKGLNTRIQGSAADIMKVKLIELHEARFDTGFLMRYTVHDEVDGDVVDREAANRVNRILNRQSFPELIVAITWEVGIGPNWKDLEDLPTILNGKVYHPNPEHEKDPTQPKWIIEEDRIAA